MIYRPVLLPLLVCSALMLSSCQSHTGVVVDSAKGASRPLAVTYAREGDAFVMLWESGDKISLLGRDGRRSVLLVPKGAEVEWDWRNPRPVVTQSGRHLLIRSPDRLSPSDSKICTLDLSTGAVKAVGTIPRGTVSRYRGAVCSPDSKWVTTLVSDGRSRRTMRLLALNLNTGRLMSLATWDTWNEGVITLRGWSRDSRLVYCVFSNDPAARVTAYKVDGKGSDLVSAIPWDAAQGGRIVVRPNDGRMLYVSGAGTVYSQELTATAPQKIADIPGADVESIQVSPTGRYLSAFFSLSEKSGSFSSGFWLVDLKNGQMVREAIKGKGDKGSEFLEFAGWHPKRDLLLVRHVSSSRTDILEYNAKRLIYDQGQAPSPGTGTRTGSG